MAVGDEGDAIGDSVVDVGLDGGAGGPITGLSDEQPLPVGMVRTRELNRCTRFSKKTADQSTLQFDFNVRTVDLR
jgi:hypothetical protein